jgi:hypothetical protein
MFMFMFMFMFMLVAVAVLLQSRGVLQHSSSACSCS